MYSVLTTDDLQQIDATAMRLLDRLGVRVDNPHIQKRLLAAGGRPASEADTVLLPEKMVRSLVAQCPSRIRLGSLDGGVTEAGPALDGKPATKPVFWTANSMHIITDKARREMRAKDLADVARLADSLEHVHGVVGTSMVDVPAGARDFVGFRVMAENTRKHLRPCIYTPTGVEAMIEMAEFLLDGVPLRQRPVFSLGYTAITPLHWSSVPLEAFEKSSGRGIPIMVNGEPTAGTTGPVTLAGAIAVAHAEVLSGLVILQLLEPGRPCIYNIGFSHIADMRSGQSTCGTPEAHLIASAGAQLAAHYKLPSASWVSADTSVCDGQTSAESMMGMLSHALAGVNAIWGIGSMESELSMSLEKMVMDNEMAGAVLRMARGVEVTPETLAESVVMDVGRGADFLSTAHTLQHFRSELWSTAFFKRGRRESWVDRGGLPSEEAARKRAQDVLAREAQPCLDGAQRERLLQIEKKWLSRL
jgi:trimethylamine---corrinoid protein Co-methyltransferase